MADEKKYTQADLDLATFETLCNAGTDVGKFLLDMTGGDHSQAIDLIKKHKTDWPEFWNKIETDLDYINLPDQGKL